VVLTVLAGVTGELKTRSGPEIVQQIEIEQFAGEP
jgi:hypothetical protein